MMEGSESLPLTNGSGSGETQKLIDTTDPDLDAEHWFKGGLKTNAIVKLAESIYCMTNIIRKL